MTFWPAPVKFWLSLTGRQTACIAADLLSESEHDSQAIARLITTDKTLGLEVIRQVEKQLPELETEDIASASWNTCGEVILADSLDDACRLAMPLPGTSGAAVCRCRGLYG